MIATQVFSVMATQVSEVEKMIRDYIEHRASSLSYHKKKNDAEKEYNKLLVNHGGEEKNFTLDQVEKIYKAYHDMLDSEEQLKIAEEKFYETEEKLKEVGRMLFHATITAEISMPPANGTGYHKKQVTVSFPNGEVVVR